MRVFTLAGSKYTKLGNNDSVTDHRKSFSSWFICNFDARISMRCSWGAKKYFCGLPTWQNTYKKYITMGKVSVFLVKFLALSYRVRMRGGGRSVLSRFHNSSSFFSFLWKIFSLKSCCKKSSRQLGWKLIFSSLLIYN